MSRWRKSGWRRARNSAVISGLTDGSAFAGALTGAQFPSPLVGEEERRAPPSPPLAKRVAGRADSGRGHEPGGGCFPEALRRRSGAVSMAALAQPPHILVALSPGPTPPRHSASPSGGREELPLLPGSGTINGVAYKATVDDSFRAAFMYAGRDENSCRHLAWQNTRCVNRN